MVLFEVSLLGLVLVGAVDVYAYKKYRDSLAVTGQRSGVNESVKRVVDAVKGENTLIMPKSGFSDASRREIEMLASHSQPQDSDLIVQDSARVGEVPILGEELELESAPEELAGEEAVVEVTQDEEAPQEDEETGFDAEKAAVDLSNSIDELRRQLKQSRGEIDSLKKEIAFLKRKKR